MTSLLGRLRNGASDALRAAAFWVATRHRRRLSDVVFVAVTGSAGKTTAKDLIAAVLATVGPVNKSPGQANRTPELLKTMLRTRRHHRFGVQELGVAGPGTIDASLELIRPAIGVVTNIGPDHLAAFRTLEATAEEKGKLVEILPPGGTAVLNADDPRVLAMRRRCRGRVITFGCAPDADVRGSDVQGAWPDRLRFTVTTGGESLAVQTQLCGVHWVSAALAAIAVARAVGVPLRDAAQALGTVAPWKARLSPETHVDGVTFIRDDWKASLWTVPVAFEFMKQARARRKIVVLGTLSDYPSHATEAVATVARDACEFADHVLVVGKWASSALRAKHRADGDQRVHTFQRVEEVSRFLRDFLVAGDLVLVKGTNPVDHLGRLVLARTRRVECWRESCGRRHFCDKCSLLERPERPRAHAPAAADPALREPVSLKAPRDALDALVIGLGNQGARYSGTRHNIGHAVVERLAASLRAEWRQEPEALVAPADWKGKRVGLVKLQALMNDSGPVLQRFAARLHLSPAACILVHDDLDQALGAVRTRAGGGDGGHNGVRSILHTFQTDAFRRVKVGIGKPSDRSQVAAYVLGPVPPAEQSVLERACADAADRVLALLSVRAPSAPAPPA
jgi:aminoacyl-tRNA hydrolase